MREAFRRDYAAARGRGRRATLGFLFVTAIDIPYHALAARRGSTPAGGLMRSIRRACTVDWRDAWRALRAAPATTTVAVLSLAFGIGANTALFSILNGLMLKSLPVRDPSRLVVIDGGSWTNPIWEAVRARQRDVFDGAAAWSATRFNLADRGETNDVTGVYASGNLFDVLGVRLVIGRPLTPADDDATGGPDGPVAVIGYGFWQRHYGGAESVIGQRLTLNRVPFTIVGVAPAGFYGLDVGQSADVFVPIGDRAQIDGSRATLDNRAVWWLEIVGRLRPAETIDQATTALRGVQPLIRRATVPPNWSARAAAQFLAEPLELQPAANGESDLRTTYVAPLQVMLAVVGAVLLIACANIANLLLARSTARRHELSLRLALGASRARLGRQLLAESAMLAAAGAAIALIVARWSSALLVAQIATSQSRVVLDLSLDWRVLGFTTLVACVTALVFGVAPALGVARVSAGEALKEQSRSVGDRRGGVRGVLVVGQVALSLALMVAAGLFARTFLALTRTPLGFDAEPLLVAHLSAPSDVPPAARLAFFVRARDAAAAVPGVESAVLSFLTPVGTTRWNTQLPASIAPALTDRQRVPWVNAVSPGWFQTMGMSVRDGRDVSTQDTADGARVMVVNESFVRRYFDGRSPVGHEIPAALEGPSSQTFRIVGVVNDAVYRSSRRGFEPTVYVPMAQVADVGRGMDLVTRAAGGTPDALTRGLAMALTQAAPSATFTIVPMSTQVGTSMRQERLVAWLAGVFGALALGLAAIGLYGVASYAVQRRQGEIGLRIALGATWSSVVGLVLRRLVWLVAVGVVLGGVLSLWASRFVATLLFTVTARDPLTFVLAAVALVVAGVVATWLPARRAAGIDPILVMKSQ